MSLAAHTNQVGTFLRYKIVEDRQYGKYYSNDHVDEVIGSAAVNDAISRKPSPYHGDHKSAYNYTRSVFRILEDTPARWRRYETAGDPPNQYLLIDLYGESHLSPGRGCFDGYVEPDPNSDNARSKSITTALNALSSHEAGLGADIGQTRKTIDEFAHMVGRFAAMLNALKRGNLRLAASNLAGMTGKRGLRSASRSAAALWLEYSYGIKPLLQDIYEAQQIVHDRLTSITDVVRGRGSGKSVVDHHGPYGMYKYHNVTKSSYRTTLLATIVNPMLYSLNQAGLINPLSIAWELVPWSFVVDWFIPVGQTLQACTAGCGLQFAGGWTTDHIESSNSLEVIPTWTGYGYGWVDPGRLEVVGFSMTRHSHAYLPMAEFYANFTPYSTTRAVNALALVRQLT